jgi:hypothetical protein
VSACGTARCARRLAVTALLAAVALAAAAPAAAQGLGVRGWGFRAGAASDPDQVIVGAHVDLGDVWEALRLQPSFEAGLGDDASSLQALVPVHYRFATGGPWRPYAGGGVLLSLISYDDDRPGRRGDDEDFDIAPVAVGGLERVRGGGSDLHLELQLGGGDAFDAKVVVGWTF